MRGQHTPLTQTQIADLKTALSDKTLTYASIQALVGVGSWEIRNFIKKNPEFQRRHARIGKSVPALEAQLLTAQKNLKEQVARVERLRKTMEEAKKAVTFSWIGSDVVVHGLGRSAIPASPEAWLTFIQRDVRKLREFIVSRMKGGA